MRGILLLMTMEQGHINEAIDMLALAEPVEARDGGSPQPLAESLSEREREVLQAIAAGMSNRELAEEFMVSVGTIKTHLNNIYGKLNVHSRTLAIAQARELHLLS